jgi:predicted HTH transcriptional regulator
MLGVVNLTANDLLSCVQKGEGPRVEFKRRLPRDERAARTLCAFANTRGGLLIVGVTDRGRVHGLHHPGDVSDRIHVLSESLLSPALRVEVQVVEVNGPRVVACSVPFSKERPHAVVLPGGDRQFLVRVGSSNRIADGPTLSALRLAKRARRGATSFEDNILAWVGMQSRNGSVPSGTATVARFARQANVSENRARKAFIKLESLGLLVGHGSGRARVFVCP